MKVGHTYARLRLRGPGVVVLVAVLLSACGAGGPSGGPSGAPAAAPAQQPDDGAVAARGRALPEPEDAAPADEPLRIGLAAATTGDAALVGLEQIAGAEIAEELLNAEGGVGGRPIEIVVADSGDDIGRARAAFEDLINGTPVVAVVGPTRPAQVFDVGYVAQQAGVPVVTASGPADGAAAVGDLVATVAAPAAELAPRVLDAVLTADPAIRRVAFLSAADDRAATTESLAQQRAAGARGLDIAAAATFRTTDPDLTVPAESALSAEPDLVVLAAPAAQGGALVRALRDLGYEGPVIGGDAMNTAALYGVCGAACEGLVLGQSYDPAAAGARNAALRDRWVQGEGTEPPQHAAQAFAAVQVLVEALRAVDTAGGLADPDLAAQRVAVNTALLAGRYDTPLGAITFSPDGEAVLDAPWVARIDMTDDGTTGRLVPLP
jgi:branched-chain amino acid transport system substrate-binding protein